MKINEKFKKFAKFTIISFVIFKIFILVYLLAIPAIVASPKVSNFVSHKLEQSLGINVKIEGVKLRTYIRPKIDFAVKKISIQNKEEKLLYLKEGKLFKANLFKR